MSNVMKKSSAASKPIFAAKFDLQYAVACEFSFERFIGGFRIFCRCDDSAECTDLQTLCEAICENGCSCCCVRDGVQVCSFNFSCNKCKCKCESLEGGCSITCSSRDSKCCDMLAAICDCIECCCKNNCCCYICFGDKCCCFGGCN
jgi:hypothetical protein